MEKWPKKLAPLTEEQERIRIDFMQYWHEVLPRRYGLVEKFNHGYPASRQRPGTTVEIGAGLGEHIQYECLADKEYIAVEILPEMAAEISRRYNEVTTIVGDCQARLPFDDASVDRVLAIHVLEHLPNLPSTVAEVHRILRPGGCFQVCIPCEGGMAYSLARKISAERAFKKRYGMSYDWFIQNEHINHPHEIVETLSEYFETQDSTYFPLRIRSVEMNLAIGLDLKPRQNA